MLGRFAVTKTNGPHCGPFVFGGKRCGTRGTDLCHMAR